MEMFPDVQKLRIITFELEVNEKCCLKDYTQAVVFRFYCIYNIVIMISTLSSPLANLERNKLLKKKITLYICVLDEQVIMH